MHKFCSVSDGIYACKKTNLMTFPSSLIFYETFMCKCVCINSYYPINTRWTSVITNNIHLIRLAKTVKYLLTASQAMQSVVDAPASTLGGSAGRAIIHLLWYKGVQSQIGSNLMRTILATAEACHLKVSVWLTVYPIAIPIIKTRTTLVQRLIVAFLTEFVKGRQIKSISSSLMPASLQYS